MGDLDDRLAVVTGAASGIGRSLCAALASRGVQVVGLDVDDDALPAALEPLGDRGTGYALDVSDAAQVAAVAASVGAAHGAPDLLFANAGVFVGGLLWESSDADWEWALGVNVRGVANTVRAFVPLMLASGRDGHVAITASLAGVISAPYSGVYCATKFAAVGLAECLHHDLSVQPGGSRVRVSCVVPAAVRTEIADAERNRPSHLGDRPRTDASATVLAALADTTARGLDADAAAAHVVDRVLAGEFYVSTSDAFDRLVPVHNETRRRHEPPQLLMYE